MSDIARLLCLPLMESRVLRETLQIFILFVLDSLWVVEAPVPESWSGGDSGFPIFPSKVSLPRTISARLLFERLVSYWSSTMIFLFALVAHRC